MTAEGTHVGAFGSREWGLMLFAGITWGASFLFIAEGLVAFEPGLIATLRIFFGALTLTFVKKARAPLPREALRPVVALGFLWMAFPFFLFAVAEQNITSALAGMLNGAVPIFAVTIAAIMLRKAPSRLQLAGLAIGTTGLILMGLPSLDSVSSAVGVLLVLVALASYGLSINIAAPLQQNYGALPVLWRSQIAALVMSLPLGGYALTQSSFAFVPLLAMIALGVGGTALAFVAMTTLIGRVGGSRASVTIYITPPVALFLGWVLRDDSVAPIAIVGSAVAILAAWVVSREKAKPQIASSGDGRRPESQT